MKDNEALALAAQHDIIDSLQKVVNRDKEIIGNLLGIVKIFKGNPPAGSEMAQLIKDAEEALQ
jgi:hypothetical protein